ncbi:hypothetical protein ACFY0G_17580 [Streptomyces sp. NPDC001552]
MSQAKPETSRQPEWRTTRCKDCGDRIEVDTDGFRTLCSCDAAY